jgi:UDP-glucose 4-epimerase
MKKRVLVTGGCGFVGRHLLAKLSQESCEIWVVDDLSIGKHPASWTLIPVEISHQQPYRQATVFSFRDQKSTLVFINADFLTVAMSELNRQPHLGYPQLPKFDEIYHLASIVGGRAIIDGDPLMVGIDMAIDSCFYLWAAKINKPDRVLYASSSAAYPVSRQRHDQAVALREDMIDFGGTLGQPDMTYGWSKMSGEYLSKIAVASYGMKVAVVRPFSGYGEDQDLSYPVPAIALRVAARQNPVYVWGTGEQGRDFVHIDDCVEACILACRSIGDASAVNIGSGQLLSFKEVAALMITLEGYDAPVKGVLSRPVGVAKRYSDPSGMRKLLGWTPRISLEEGMQRVLEGARARLRQGIVPEVLNVQ